MKRQISFFLITFFLFSAISGLAQTAEQHSQAGAARIREHKYEDAIHEFTLAIAMQPDNMEAYYLRGMAKFVMHDSTSEADFTKVIELHPDHYKAYTYRGVTKSRKADYQGATRDLSKAIEIKPDFPDAYFYRGNMKMDEKDYGGAITDLDSAIALKPDYTAAFYMKGMTEFLQKDYKSSISEFSRTIELNKAEYTPGAYYFRGLAEVHEELKDVACQDFKKAQDAGHKSAGAAIVKYCH